MPVGLFDNDLLHVSAMPSESPCHYMRDKIERDIRLNFIRTAGHCPSVIPVWLYTLWSIWKIWVVNGESERDIGPDLSDRKQPGDGRSIDW